MIMNKQDKQSAKPSKPLSSWLPWAFVVLGFLGFLDASYLTVSHFTGSAVNCSITAGCDTVLSSKYSQIFGIPLALFGLFYYLLILGTAFFYLETGKKDALKILTCATVFGFLFSGWLVYLQLFVLDSICQYCMLSAINSTILMIMGLKFIPYWRDSK